MKPLAFIFEQPSYLHLDNRNAWQDKMAEMENYLFHKTYLTVTEACQYL